MNMKLWAADPEAGTSKVPYKKNPHKAKWSPLAGGDISSFYHYNLGSIFPKGPLREVTG